MGDPLPVVLRDRARLDIEEAVEWYRDEADANTALRFIDVLEATLRQVGRHPKTGSPRYAVELELPGLRSLPLSGFPQMIFYVERADHVDVWRVLHGHRDIPAWMSEPPDAAPDVKTT